MYFHVDHTSKKGRFHEKNEDTYYIGDNFVIIADGMGGESSGDIASKIAVKTISRFLAKTKIEDLSEISAKRLMSEAIAKADNDISYFINDNPESAGMGTTVLLALYNADKLYLSWCGDSHCYLIKNGVISSLTKDHSFVQELIDKKIITIEESLTHPDNNLITRFVGGGDYSCLPDFTFHKVATDDIFILCSDGLSGYCLGEDINQCVNLCNCKLGLTHELLNLAISHGSDDDTTIITLTATDRDICRHSKIFKWFKRGKHLLNQI